MTRWIVLGIFAYLAAAMGLAALIWIHVSRQERREWVRGIERMVHEDWERTYGSW